MGRTGAIVFGALIFCALASGRAAWNPRVTLAEGPWLNQDLGPTAALAIQNIVGGDDTVHVVFIQDKELTVISCPNLDCAQPTVAQSGADYGSDAAVAAGVTNDGNLVVAVVNESHSVDLFRCEQQACSSLAKHPIATNAGPTSEVAIQNIPGGPTEIAVAFVKNNRVTAVLCPESTCTTDTNEITFDPFTASPSGLSLATSAAGNPVAAYTAEFNNVRNLYYAHCSNTECSTVPTICTAATNPLASTRTSMRFQSSGRWYEAYVPQAGDVTMIESDDLCGQGPSFPLGFEVAPGSGTDATFDLDVVDDQIEFVHTSSGQEAGVFLNRCVNLLCTQRDRSTIHSGSSRLASFSKRGHKRVVTFVGGNGHLNVAISGNPFPSGPRFDLEVCVRDPDDDAVPGAYINLRQEGEVRRIQDVVAAANGCALAVIDSEQDTAIEVTPPPNRLDLTTAQHTFPAPGSQPFRAAGSTNVTLPNARPKPPEVTLNSNGDINGVPVLANTWPLDITGSGVCPNASSATFSISPGGPSGSLTEIAPGVYHADAPAPGLSRHGLVTFTITITCPSPQQPAVFVFDAYIDPSGFVRTVGGAPIPGATVELRRSLEEDGPFLPVADGSLVMSPSNRTNSDVTDAAGHFGWDVLSGYYRVRASAPECHKPGDAGTPFVESAVLTIPPAVLDLDLRLDCTGPNSPALDPNCDDALSLADAVTIGRSVALLPAGTTCNMDANRDTEVDSADILLVLRLLTGLDPGLGSD